MSITSIKFAKRTQADSLGRNGFFNTHGLSVMCSQGEVWLEPITSREQIGRARAVVPVEALPELIAALQGMLPVPGAVEPKAVVPSLISEDEATAFLRGQIENGYMDGESMATRLARYGLMEPAAWSEEIRERIEMQQNGDDNDQLVTLFCI